MNGTPNWARQYTRGEQNLGTPSGRVSARPFPGGQKVGFLSPLANTPFGQQTSAKVAELCRYTATEDVIQKQVIVDITTPSERLTCGFQLFLQRDGVVSDIPVAQGVSPCVATLYAMGVNPLHGQRGQLQPLTVFNPPFQYRIDPIYRDTRLVVDVNQLNWDFSATFTGGTLVLIANWEPNVEMDAAELNRLYANCSLAPSGLIII